MVVPKPPPTDVRPLPHVVEIRIRFGDVDSSGAVFFPRYWEWMAVGIDEYFLSAGLIYPTLDWGVHVAGQQITSNFIFGKGQLRVHRRSTIGDVLAVHTALKELQKKTVLFDCRIFDHTHGALLATGSAKSIWIDTERFKSAEIREQVTEILLYSQRGLAPQPEELF